MSHYYLDSRNQPAGPLSLEQIRTKAAAGEIPANPMVAAVGSTHWQSLRQMNGSGAVDAESPLATVLADVVQSVRGPLAGLFNPAYLHGSIHAARLTGHYCVTIGAAIAVIYVLYSSFREFSLNVLLGGILSLLILSVAHYTTRRFLKANESMIAQTRLSSTALPDCMAMIVLGTALAGIVGSILAVVRVGWPAWQVPINALFTLWLWTVFSAIAFHPTVARVEFAPGDAGEEALEVVQFLLKAALLLVPILFGAWSVIAVAGLVVAFFSTEIAADVLGLAGHPRLPHPFGARGGGDPGFRAISLLTAACLLPLLAHLGYLVASWPLSFWRSMIAVPNRIDALRRGVPHGAGAPISTPPAS